ncbi:unnamed protein product [Cuscuta campestris]|uniref:Retrovirus-related Pol polyprotein from transposon TNT 1-94 n=1 Tax=Cuscuta campestris TaxID=132261 RepID=A0A484MKQ8_9ASTE|nr:unnamed protein product [Cuscuta campestris]
MSVIRLSLTKNVAFNILKEKTAKEIMDALSNMYEKPSAANKVFLIRELVNTRMKKGTSVTEHMNKLNSILARLLLSVGIKFDDEVQALLLLSSLPDSWSGKVTTVTGSVGPDGFTFDQIRDLALGEDVRRKSSGESSGELLHVGRGRRNSRGSGSRNRQRSQSKTRDNSGVTCLKCKEVMDSGASFHATHSGEAWQNLVIGDFGKDVRVVPGLKKKFDFCQAIGRTRTRGEVQRQAVEGREEKGKKSGSLYMVGLPSEGLTVPVQKKNKVRFTESRGHKKGVTGPVRGICGSGSSRGASAKLPRRQWVRRTSIPAVGTSPENFLLSTESVCSQHVSGSGSVHQQWESVGTGDKSMADLVVTDRLELKRASTGLSVV